MIFLIIVPADWATGNAARGSVSESSHASVVADDASTSKQLGSRKDSNSGTSPVATS